jgi:hypothetical protein
VLLLRKILDGRAKLRHFLLTGHKSRDNLSNTYTALNPYNCAGLSLASSFDAISPLVLLLCELLAARPCHLRTPNRTILEAGALRRSWQSEPSG